MKFYMWSLSRGQDAAPADENVAEYSKALLNESREELVRADNKASILLASTGIAVGVLLTAFLSADDWSPTTLHARFQWIWWLGVLIVAVAIGYLSSAVYPRTQAKGARPNTIAYFGDVVAAECKHQVEELLEKSAKNPNERLVDQIIQVSGIVQKKYIAIRRAMWCLAFGAIACVLSVLLNTVFN